MIVRDIIREEDRNKRIEEVTQNRYILEIVHGNKEVISVKEVNDSIVSEGHGIPA